ncbi:branched-chain-amino-acid aminotransferase-like protein 2 isoform X2 [Lingula anatina]|uniref:Branched-chain-amino-acid aminotransferase-like protein 2 isoform X2 n=1 Tax=Lingula anatina TaxID=7574 RepID=A0A1S3JP55_LINAN|nr:branched-chain-amino-acid aminotransferase-like protein 2 isoform X2 [Lingula anatina]|eukprot:XP_013411779.1 branched-chain-amino-acid aminotransferase-like protein 2 isoform X2 [Lingula anatina]
MTCSPERNFKPFYFGEERLSNRYSDGVDTSNFSSTTGNFKKSKAEYEEDYPGFDLIFGKEMAVYLMGKLDTMDYIPSGYQHTFLIRNPKQATPDLYKCLTDKERNGCDHFDKLEATYKPIHQLFHLIKKETGQTPVLIDADDLLNDPAGIVKRYCSLTGIEFVPSMLQWEAGSTKDTHWHRWPGWYEELTTSTGFKKLEEVSSQKPPDLNDLPVEVQESIQENMPLYEELKEYRIQV